VPARFFSIMHIKTAPIDGAVSVDSEIRRPGAKYSRDFTAVYGR
jgi:hypothetical protein